MVGQRLVELVKLADQLYVVACFGIRRNLVLVFSARIQEMADYADRRAKP